MKQGGIETSIEPGLVARLVRGAKYVFTGQADWFGPGVPLPPTAPEAVEGRQFQFPISTNTVISTKTDGITFGQLRAFADVADVVRLLIETRKDQVCGLNWVVKRKDADNSKATRAPKKSVIDTRVQAVSEFLLSPDKDHTWSEWLRLVLEDMFVLDAPTLYIQRTRGGDVYALRPIDGGTIKRIIDTHGWVPMPPEPAYQQILQGTAAVNYTRDELIYKPRNPRTNRIYGYSPVEQIVVTMKLLLSRQASNLGYYEDGTVPDGFLTAPAGWTPQQIKEMQNILDAQLSGNLADRRKLRMVPSDAKYTATKEPALKNDYDEWLARVACFAFSYPPTPFIRQMNRSTSDNAKESADEEGLQPVTRWVKELVDEIIQRRLGFHDLEFLFEDKEAQDPLERAQIDQIYVQCGVLQPDEIRAEMGLDPLPESEPAQPTQSADDANPDGTDDPPDEPPQGKKKVTKAVGDPDPQHVHDATDLTAAEQKLQETIAAGLKLAQESVVQQVKDATGAVPEGAAVADVSGLIDQLSVEALAEVRPELVQALEAAAKDGAQHGLVQLNIGGEDMLSLVNDRAVEFAQQRAAELIATDGTGGELVEATRNLIRATVQQAVEEGWSSRQLANALEDSYAFSAQRAATIARTELAFADSRGNLASYIASGVVKRKRWLLGPDPCPVCVGNADAGEIDLQQEFPGGVMAPPQHPNCPCTFVPITED